MIFFYTVLLLVGYFYSKKIGKRNHFLVGFLFLSAWVIIQYILLRYIVLSQLHHPIFSPNYYASEFADSIGDMLLKVISILVLLLFVTNGKGIKAKWNQNRLIVVSLIPLAGILSYFITETLILDSTLEFDIKSILQLKQDMIFLLCCLVLIHLCFSVFVLLLLQLFKDSVSVQSKLYYLIGAHSFLLVINSIFWQQELMHIALLFSLIISISFTFIHNLRKHSSYILYIIFLIVFATYSGVVVDRVYQKKIEKEVLHLADKLQKERNPILEYQLKQLKKVLSNASISSVDKLHQMSEQFLIENHIWDYEVSVSYDFTDQNKTKVHEDIYFADTGHFTRTTYFVKYNLRDTNCIVQLAHLPNFSEETLHYFVKSPSLSNQLIDKYHLAIYKNGIPIIQSNEINYSFLDTDGLLKPFHIYQQQYYKHHIISTNEKIIILSSQGSDLFQFLGLISFLFILFSICFILIIFARLSLGDIHMYLTLRNRISIGMLGVITLILFTVVFFISLNVNEEYQEYNEARLERKAKSVLKAFEYNLNNVQEGQDVEKHLQYQIESISTIHNVDVNLFDYQGSLRATSEPILFKAHLFSSKLDKRLLDAVHTKENEYFVRTEVVNDFSFASAYLPLKVGREWMILNIAYLSSEKDFDKELASFLTGIINIFVFSLILGIFVSILISSYITNSLRLIAKKFQTIHLGDKNEPIEWKTDDEIGMLVQAYNTMLIELEKSAILLAKTEREEAWREMAKQVAHEIKNPLTPMKLSIQHLQRAIQEGSDQVDKMSRQVTATLIEQIDSLTHIASEFSNYAKMPRPKLEPIVVHDVVESVHLLFKEASNIQVTLTTEIAEDIRVMGDRDQFIRIMNNIIKNAVQAIPKEKNGLINITVKQDVSTVIISVRDNGIGISADQKEKVFSPNFTTKSSGTGIGLAMTKNYVTYMNGDIWFDSEAGIGTTFYIKLPILL